jgi:hypothetical protein
VGQEQEAGELVRAHHKPLSRTAWALVLIRLGLLDLINLGSSGYLSTRSTLNSLLTGILFKMLTWPGMKRFIDLNIISIIYKNNVCVFGFRHEAIRNLL